eukprot:TRINITY_DN364_c0_g1_i2.p1 TRINITY_DN364_c0_g1~~TRINITY_DN364_c0_g1_i2.p1  ORF type:complete len:135 (+),score=20.12 TRINITY_DN364_c0_g1_i2:47-451(+)
MAAVVSVPLLSSATAAVNREPVFRSSKGELLGSPAVSFSHSLSRAAPAFSAPSTVICPVAKRVCDLTGKRRNVANSVSFSNHRTKKLQQPNLQYKRVWWEKGQRFVRLRLSTKAIKTLEWKSLEEMAKEGNTLM